MSRQFVLRLSCPDQAGIVARLSGWILSTNGNITAADQHSTDPKSGQFFIRIEFFLSKPNPISDLRQSFMPLANELKANWNLDEVDHKPTIGVLVSKPSHCLTEIISSYQSGDLGCEIGVVVSNHPDHRQVVEAAGFPYHVVSVSPTNKCEDEILEKIAATDFLVLARYMQILSEYFIQTYAKPIINIHHSFLPSFAGANPYQQAFDRGVKLIGATAHYVTKDLDAGPIISQTAVPVTHRADVGKLKRKGRDCERQCLMEAIQLHLENRIHVYQNKTIVFEG